MTIEKVKSVLFSSLKVQTASTLQDGAFMIKMALSQTQLDPNWKVKLVLFSSLEVQIASTLQDGAFIIKLFYSKPNWKVKLVLFSSLELQVPYKMVRL